MSAKKNIPPAQEEVERRVRLKLEHGDITDLSSLLGEPYETTKNKLDPNKPAAKSDAYKFARVMWHMRQLEDGDRKAREVFDELYDLVFPTADALQLASRIENDARRLREKLAAGTQ